MEMFYEMMYVGYEFYFVFVYGDVVDELVELGCMLCMEIKLYVVKWIREKRVFYLLIGVGFENWKILRK